MDRQRRDLFGIVGPASELRPSRFKQLGVALALSGWFLLVYNGCNHLAALRPHLVGSCAFAWEAHYPFVPWMIVPYWSIDLAFFTAPFFCTSGFLLRQHFRRVALAIAIAGFFFVAFPLTLIYQRPQVEGVLGLLFGSLENYNNFYNCAPSLHIALAVLLWPIYVTPARGLWKIVLAFWLFLVGLSTLFCWQHYILDVISGQLLGLFCLMVFPSVPLKSPHRDPGAGINARRDLGHRYAAGAALLVLAMLVSWPVGMFFMWPALSLAVVAAAYYGAGPVVFGKHRGRLLGGTRWLLAPYLWVLAWTARRFLSGQALYLELEPGLFLGARLNSQQAARMAAPAVLDLTAEYDENPEFLQRTYSNVPILDLTAPSQDQLLQAVEFLRRHPACYVHCSLGLGRTSAVAVAYLMLVRDLSLEQALQRMQQVHPRMRLAPATRRALENLVNINQDRMSKIGQKSLVERP